MSTATATGDAAAAAAPKKGKKKLIIIIAAALLVVLAGGGTAVFMMKKKAAAEAAAAEEGEGDGEGAAKPKAKAQKAAKADPKAVPTFVPLDPFTVNLADRDAERYAQVGITLEIEDAKLGDQIKAFMPAIRNNILLAIADRTAAELQSREGKTALAERVKRETARALGYDVPEPAAAAQADDTAEEDAPKKKPKKKAKPADEADLPITAVHFSNFIVQ
jgi:flagellar FliL protein